MEGVRSPLKNVERFKAALAGLSDAEQWGEGVDVIGGEVGLWGALFTLETRARFQLKGFDN